MIIQLRPLGTRAAPSDTAAPSLPPQILTCTPGLQTPVAAQRQGRLRLTSGRLCWRPVLRHPASMSEPRSSRPPWALLSYYSHSSGCSRGCQTSKRTFTRSLSLSLSLSLLSLYPPLLVSLLLPCLPCSCVCLIALSEEQSGVVYFTWRLVARVFVKVNKRCDMWKERGAVSFQGELLLVSTTPE